MKKAVSALALTAAVVLGTIGLTVGTASAHTATMTYDCFTVTVHFTDFHVAPPGSSGVNSATVTVNGVGHNFTWTTANFVAEVPFVSHDGDPDVVVSASYQSSIDNFPTKVADATFPADDCAPSPTTTTTAPTTTTIPIQVSPEVVTRGAAVVAAQAIVASPAFTG